MTRSWRIHRAAVLAILLHAAAFAQPREYDWSATQEIAPGVRYTHLALTEPRVMNMFAMRIDARNPRIRFHTTERFPEWVGNLNETRRTTTRDFMREARTAGMNMVAAINADAFEPWPAPYARRSPSDLRGLAVSEGELVSPPLEDGATFVVYNDGRVAISHTIRSVEGIKVAVSGFAIVLEDGVASGADQRLAPRTGIGVSADGQYVYWLVIDGRRHASQGATTEEVGRWLLHFGANDGVNLDGGGSASMVRHDPTAEGDGVVLLNNPVGDGTDWLKSDPSVEKEKYRPTERANGNNLGVYLVSEKQ